jgi:hypothetical protein
MAVRLFYGVISGNFNDEINRVCYYIKNNHKAYLAHRRLE